MPREDRRKIFMNKKHLIYFISVLILIAVAFLVFIRGKGLEVDPTDVIQEQTDVIQEHNDDAPVPVEQLVEEFNEELAETGETVNSDDFSEYQEEYVVEIQEDEVAEIY